MNIASGSHLLIIIISVLMSAFFSGMEIAFVSANRLKIELDKKQKVFPARIITLFINNSSQFISTMLVGNNIALVIYGIAMAEVLEPFILILTENTLGGLLLQIVIATLIIIVTAEYLPKTIFQRTSNKALKIFALPVLVFYILLYPIAKFSTFLSNGILSGLFKVKIDSKNQDLVFSKIDLNNYISQPEIISRDESKVQNDIKIFRNALGFSEIKVRECMVPRNELVAIDVEADLEELTRIFTETGYSKIPVYQEDIDHIIGYFHVADIFNKPRSIQSALKEMPIVPETIHAHKLLKRLIRTHKSIALIVDEFGGTAGIVTIEDLMEEIVGEIEDEHDKMELIEQKQEDTYYLSARFEIDYINEKYGFDLPENESYETIAGFIIDYFKDIPDEGNEIETNQYVIRVESVGENKIETVSIKPRQEAPKNGKEERAENL